MGSLVNRAIQQGLVTPAQQPQQEKKPDFLQGLVQGISQPFLKLGSSVVGAIEGVGDLGGAAIAKVTGNQEQADRLVNDAYQAMTKERDYGYFGKARPVGGAPVTGDVGRDVLGGIKDIVGTGLEVGSYLSPTSIASQAEKAAARAAIQAGKAAAKPSLMSLAKGGMLAGSLGSVGAEAQKQDSTPGSLLSAGISGGLLGGVVGAAVPAAGQGIKKVSNLGKEGLSSSARFASSQLTRLNPETAALAKAGKISDAALEKSPQEMTQDLVGRVQKAFDDRFSALKETGAAYEDIRKVPLAVKQQIERAPSGLPKFVVDTLQNKFGVLVDDAGKLSTNQYSRVTDADLKGIQSVLDQYGKSPALDADVILNTRQALDSAANWGGFYNDNADRVAKALRAEYDKYGKKAIPGLSNVDEKFAPEKQFLGELRKMLYESPQKQQAGEIRASAYSDLSNLLSNAKVTKRARIEKLVPGITEEIRVLKALQDVAHAEGQKTGTYISSTLVGGGLFTGNPALVAGSLLYGVFGTPKNFVRLLRKVGEAEKFGSYVVEQTIGKIMKGEKLGEKSLQLIRAAVTAAQRGAVIGQSKSESD